MLYIDDKGFVICDMSGEFIRFTQSAIEASDCIDKQVWVDWAKEKCIGAVYAILAKET